MSLPKIATEKQHEEWRPVDGYEGIYIVSSLGRFASVRNGKFKLRKTPPDGNGYCTVSLSKNGVHRGSKFHTLVAVAFLGRSDLNVNHKNGIKDDNRVSNLEWVTRSQNIQHAIKNGLLPTGENAFQAKLTNIQADRIKSSKQSTSSLMAKYSVSRSLVNMLRRGEARKHD